MQDRLQLGRMLVEAKLLTEEQLKMAVEFQKSVGGKLGAIMVKLGFIEEATLIKFIARQQGLPIVNLDELILPENLVKRIPPKLIEKHGVLPIRYHDGVLTVATADPFDYEALEEIQLAVDYRIEVQLAPRTQILRSIQLLLHAEPGPVKEKSKDQLLKDLEDEERAAGREPSALLLEALIPLLVQKGVITEAELATKARELEGTRER
jgi:type IV pilus assembly protein PilB